eukprot:1486537-Alexandrium_andersonii.AAC.1
MSFLANWPDGDQTLSGLAYALPSQPRTSEHQGLIVICSAIARTCTSVTTPCRCVQPDAFG